jgi:hypothetical protein
MSFEAWGARPLLLLLRSFVDAIYSPSHSSALFFHTIKELKKRMKEITSFEPEELRAWSGQAAEREKMSRALEEAKT